MFSNVVLFACTILVAIPLINSIDEYDPAWEVEYDELRRRLLHYQVLPNIISHCPRHWANVSWPSQQIVARIGNKFPYEMVAEPPVVTYPCNDSTYFTLLFTDCDDVINSHPTMKEYQLWYVVNIPGCQIEKGEEHLAYVRPQVQKAHSRVSVVVFRQLEKLNMTGHVFAYPKNRAYFMAMEVIYRLNSRLHAATVYKVAKPGTHNATTTDRPKPFQ